MEGFQIKYNRYNRGYHRGIHPAGRRDVTVTLSGLNCNTPDSLVFEYIKKFVGQFLSEEIIYAKHGDGPLKGMKNGERKYQVIFNGGSPNGNFSFY